MKRKREFDIIYDYIEKHGEIRTFGYALDLKKVIFKGHEIHINNFIFVALEAEEGKTLYFFKSERYYDSSTIQWSIFGFNFMKRKFPQEYLKLLYLCKPITIKVLRQ